MKYEGAIHRITKNEIWIRFNSSFHTSINKNRYDEYNVIFSVNRICYRRCHQAVDVALNHLTTDWLFPKSLKLNEFVVTMEDEDDDVNNESCENGVQIGDKNSTNTSEREKTGREPDGIDESSLGIEDSFQSISIHNTSESMPAHSTMVDSFRLSAENSFSSEGNNSSANSSKRSLSGVSIQNLLSRKEITKEIKGINGTVDVTSKLSNNESVDKSVSSNDSGLNRSENECSNESKKKCIALPSNSSHAKAMNASKPAPNFCMTFDRRVVIDEQLGSHVRTVPKANVNIERIEWFNPNLNWYQRHAVRNILKREAAPLPYIVFGPPGTGKTITLVEAALQIIKLVPDSRLLIGTPSNSAANLIAERMLASDLLSPGTLVRLCSHHYLSNDNCNVSEKLRPYCTVAEIKVVEADLLDGDEDTSKGIYKGMARDILGRHRVTIGTCVTLGVLYNLGFSQSHFTHILVDEAGQATEPEILIPLAFLDDKYGQTILAGDPMQLGPVVQSQYAAKLGMEESFLMRLLNRFPYTRDILSFPKTCGYDPRIVTRLVNNYRSLPEILKLPSSMFYENALIPQVNEVDSIEAKTLLLLKAELPLREGLEGVTSLLPPALMFHGVRGVNYQEEDSPSWFNPHEVVQAVSYVRKFYSLGFNADQIGIITPYQKQVLKIRNSLSALDSQVPKVGSVEEFQGQERMVIILSAVRSSSTFMTYDAKHSLGFVSSPQRLNVALTRARCLLIVLGNPHLLNCDPYWRTVLKYCIKNNAYCGCDLPAELD